MSAKAGWYPDPGGGQGLFRYWDGKAWSAATTANPQAAPPPQGIGQPPASQPGYGQQVPGQQAYGQGTSAYADYQQARRRKSPVGWWIGAAALLVVLAVVAVFAIRAIGTNTGVTGTPPGGQPTGEVCPPEDSEVESPLPKPNDGRVHGGPVSYPTLGSPWSAPRGDTRVPFGRDVQSQVVDVEPNYAPGQSWVASVLVGELQAGDGFFTPEQGSQIVVRCILGRFYGDAEVRSDVKVNKATTIDGKPGWVVESQLSFDIPNLKTKGELLIVAIVSSGSTAGLYYASIPDTVPELVQPARDALRELRVDG